MKWIGVLTIIFGAILFCAVTAFEKSLTQVQFVAEEQVVSEPMHIMLPPGTKFVKGTGKNGSKFVDIHSEAATYIPIAKYLGLAKLGGLVICVLGAVGFSFERIRERLKRDHELSQLTNREGTYEPEPQRELKNNQRKSQFSGVFCFEGEYTSYASGKWCKVHLLDSGLVFYEGQDPTEVPYQGIQKVSQYRAQRFGSAVRIEFEGRVLSLAIRPENPRDWYVNVNYNETLELFQELSLKIREDKAVRSK